MTTRAAKRKATLEAKKPTLNVVKILGVDIKLTPPLRQGELYEVFSSAGVNAPAAFAAALGLCWDGPDRPKASYKGNVREYGLAVTDELSARGVGIGSIQAAGALSWKLISDALKMNDVSGEAVEDAKDFTSRAKGASTTP